MEGDKWRLVGQLTSCPKVGVQEYGAWRTEVNSHGSRRVQGAALGGPKSTHKVTAGQVGQMMTHGKPNEQLP